MTIGKVNASWAIFESCRDFTFIGRDVVASASGVYVRFYDLRNERARMDRFDGEERGDGVNCLAGHPVAPVFSVVEKRPNPRISIFAYPSIRRISLCADSDREIGYLCCAFAGSDYLLAQSDYPHYRLILWHWRSGDRLTSVDARIAENLNLEGTRITCSTTGSHLVARFSPTTGYLSVYRILACSNTVRLHPFETRFERKPISCRWSLDCTLLCCDELANVWSLDFDATENRRRVKMIIENSADGNASRGCCTPVPVRGGILIVDDGSLNGEARVEFFRKPSSRDGKDEWITAWTLSLSFNPRHAAMDPNRDVVLLLGEDDCLYRMSDPSSDRPPRIEQLLHAENGYASIVSLSGSHFAALDRRDRLAILDASSGRRVCSTKRPLAHHGKVTGLASCPSFMLLATCSSAGNCLLLDAATPSSPNVACCFHLQKESLDRLKFSEGGRFLGVAAIDVGRLFLLSWKVDALGQKSTARSVTWINVERTLIDFLVHESKEEFLATAIVLLSATKGSSGNRGIGDEVAVYSCRFSDDFHEHPDRVARLPSAVNSLDAGGKGNHETVGVSCPSKLFHRIRFQDNFRSATLFDEFPSLHQTAGGLETKVSRERSILLTHGFDGLIVTRDMEEPRRVLSLFVAHHRADGGTLNAILLDDGIVSLGRNGDLVKNQLPHRCPGPRWIDRQGSRSIRPAPLEMETWVDATSRRRTVAEEKRNLALRSSILRDWNEVKRRVKELLDANEQEPATSRLPLATFDLNREAVERWKLETMKRTEDSALKEAEEQTARLERTYRCLRERFLDSMIVRPTSIYSLFGRTRVINYPLAKPTPRDLDVQSWCRFSMETGESVLRLEQRAGCREDSEEARNRSFVEILEASVETERWEREAKIRFNERFEEVRRARRSGAKAARERANETARLVRELEITFRVDASSKLLEAPVEGADEGEEEEMEAEGEEEDSFHENEQPCRGEDILASKPPSVVEDCDVDEFRRDALRRMMDGALEVSLEVAAKRDVEKPECLLRNRRCEYTEKDAREVEAYERKLQERRDAREKYREMVGSEIERIRGEFFRDAKAFEDTLHELSTEKLRVERSILSRRLTHLQEALLRRRITREKRDIRREIQLKLQPAIERTRYLVQRCDLFEAAVVELRDRYEVTRKRDKLLEGKFRAEFPDGNPLLADYLFRHYRRRPRVLLAANSVVFLTELASCVIEERPSDFLPRECSNYLRALEKLDAMPDDEATIKLTSDRWRTLCRHRRVKIEAETRVKSCAVDLAEAEQSLAFLRNASTVARSAVSRRRETIDRMEKCSTNVDEVTLHLTREQLRIELFGCPQSDCEDAVLVPRSELTCLNQAIMDAEQRKATAARKLARVQRNVSMQEWRHACAKATMENLMEQAGDIDHVKSSRLARECCGVSLRDKETTRTARRRERREKSKLVLTETKEWQRRNAKLDERIDRSMVELNRTIAATREPARSRLVAFRADRLASIRRKSRLARRVRDNFDELSNLASCLESLKLRTYPTLRTTT